MFRLCATIGILLFACATHAGEREAVLAELGAAGWHATGWTGKGVKVAVLDSGFRGYRERLGRSLPKVVTVKSFRADGDLESRPSGHGVRCAEVVHAVAPDADIIFADWEPDRPETFIRAVRWAREQGAGVITCSVVIPGWGDGTGGGPIHAALAAALGAGDKVDHPIMVAAAGNLARRHWAGDFRGTGEAHEWAAGRVDNRLDPWPGQPLSVDLWSANGSTYRLRLMDDEGREADRVRYSVNAVGGVSARLTPEPGKSYGLRVERLRGDRGPFRVTVLGASPADFTSANSIPFPADNARVLAIGAVDTTGSRLPFSGCGMAGAKPDFVARVPFPGRGSDSFGGTSAAAPQAAGLAALVRGRHLDWTADRVRSFLARHAADLGPPGHDAETGFGLPRLP